MLCLVNSWNFVAHFDNSYLFAASLEILKIYENTNANAQLSLVVNEQ